MPLADDDRRTIHFTTLFSLALQGVDKLTMEGFSIPHLNKVVIVNFVYIPCILRPVLLLPLLLYFYVNFVYHYDSPVKS
jgi:hypothetical protein